MGNNNPNTKIIIKREIAGYDSNNNPIYREIRVPVHTQKPQTVRRTQPAPAAVRQKKSVKKTKQNLIKKLILILIISMTALIPVNIVADSNSAVLQAMPQDRHHSVPPEEL